jgi:hypothetical protein
MLESRENKTFGAILLFFVLPILIGICTESNIRAENLTFTLKAGEYQIIDVGKGDQKIKMGDFGNLLIPGEPMLPARTFMIAVPPEARVVSVNISGAEVISLPGKYQIRPAPAVLPSDDRQEIIREKRSEWQRNYEAAYSSDAAYPGFVGRYQGAGGLRKYNFVRVAYFPFSYRPQSGRLFFTPYVTVSIDYDLVTSLNQKFYRDMSDTKGDQHASQLLANYSQARGWYNTLQLSETPKQSYDYLIITTDALLNAVNSLVNWKDSIGYTVNVVTTTWIQNNYTGTDLQQKIRNFLIDKYLEWGTEYLLLVGDNTTIPMRRCYPNPSDHSSGSDYSPPTDYYYAELTSNWDSDGDGFYGEYGQDSIDFVSELAVGRIPYSDSASVSSICRKLINFEKDSSSWKNNALLLGAMSNYANEDETGLPRTDGAVLMEEMISDMLTGWNYTTMYEKEGTDSSAYSCDYPLNWTNVMDNWSANDYGVVNWWAHGSYDAAWRKWWGGDYNSNGIPDGSEMYWDTFIQNSDATSLDDGHSAIIFSCSCDNAWPERANLAKTLLKNGSAGIVGATRISWYNENWEDELSGGNASMDYYFFYYLIHEEEKVGDALFSARIFFFNNLFWSLNDPDWTPQANMLDFCLYGDPALVREGISNYICGDCNSDGNIDAGDVVYLINYLYRSGPVPNPLLASDTNRDGVVDAGDVVYLINYLFKEGPSPCGT